MIGRYTKEESLRFEVPDGVRRVLVRSPQSEYFLVFEYDKAFHKKQQSEPH